MNFKTQKILTIAAALVVVASGCTIAKDESDPMIKQTQFNSSIPADQPGVAGVPGALVPVGSGVSARITNALESKVSPTAGNFKTALDQFGGNLSLTQNPRRSSGAGDVTMIAYAACADVSNGNLQTAYNITGATGAAAKTGLVAAGRRILDQCLGGLASNATYSAQVDAEFGKLVDSVGTQTTKIAFNTVCVAATSFCTQYVGF